AAERGTRFVFDVEACVPDVGDCPGRRRIRLSWYRFEGGGEGAASPGTTSTPWPGERWRLNVRLKRPHALHNPGVFDAELRALEEGISATGYVRTSRRAPVPNQRLEPDGWTIAAAFESARASLRDAMHAALRDE